MTDWILAALALIGFVAFISVLLIFVAEPNLIIIALIGILLAVWDFWRELSGRKGG